MSDRCCKLKEKLYSSPAKTRVESLVWHTDLKILFQYSDVGIYFGATHHRTNASQIHAVSKTSQLDFKYFYWTETELEKKEKKESMHAFACCPLGKKRLRAEIWSFFFFFSILKLIFLLEKLLSTNISRAMLFVSRLHACARMHMRTTHARTHTHTHAHFGVFDSQRHFPSCFSSFLSVLALGPTVILRVYSCLDLGPETGRLQHV